MAMEVRDGLAEVHDAAIVVGDDATEVDEHTTRLDDAAQLAGVQALAQSLRSTFGSGCQPGAMRVFAKLTAECSDPITFRRYAGAARLLLARREFDIMGATVRLLRTAASRSGGLSSDGESKLVQ